MNQHVRRCQSFLWYQSVPVSTMIPSTFSPHQNTSAAFIRCNFIDSSSVWRHTMSMKNIKRVRTSRTYDLIYGTCESDRIHSETRNKNTVWFNSTGWSWIRLIKCWTVTINLVYFDLISFNSFKHLKVTWWDTQRRTHLLPVLSEYNAFISMYGSLWMTILKCIIMIIIIIKMEVVLHRGNCSLWWNETISFSVKTGDFPSDQNIKSALRSGPQPITALRSGPQPITALRSGPQPITALRSGPQPITALRSGPQPITAVVVERKRPLASVQTDLAWQTLLWDGGETWTRPAGQQNTRSFQKHSEPEELEVHSLASCLQYLKLWLDLEHTGVTWSWKTLDITVQHCVTVVLLYI